MDADGRTALFRAVERGHVRVAELLLANGADPHAGGSGNSMLLHMAAFHGNPGMVAFLLEHKEKLGLDPDAPNHMDETAIFLAAKGKHVDVLALLLRHGAAPRLKSTSDATLMHMAAFHGDMRIVALLLRHREKLDLLALDDEGRTAFFRAVERGYIDVAKLLLENSAAPALYNKNNTMEQFLRIAAFHGDVKAVRFLLENKETLRLDIDAQNGKGETAMFQAARNGRTEIVDLLLENGADPCLKNADNKTALQVAVYEGHLAAVRLLAGRKEKLGIDLNAPNGDGETVLFIAVQEGHAAVADLLIEQGADPEQACDGDAMAIFWMNFGMLEEKRDRLADASAYFERAAASAPDEDVPLLALVRVQRKQQDLEATLHALDRLIALQPDEAGHVLRKADVLMQANDARRAEAVLLGHRPVDPAILNRWFDMLARQGRHEELVERLAELVAEIPDSPMLRYFFGRAYEESELYEDALKQYSRAHELDAEDIDAIRKLFMINEVLGDLAKSKEWLETGLRLYPDKAYELYKFGLHHKYVAGDDALIRLHRAAEKMSRYSEGDQMFLHYALGKANDDIGDFRAEFHHYALAGKLKDETSDQAGNRNYIASYEPVFNALKQRLRPETIARLRSQGNRSDLPVFIVGMPRSGTTKLEQNLASHPDIVGAGELPFLYDSVANLEVEGFIPLPDPARDNAKQSLERRGAEYVNKLKAKASGSPRRIVDKMPGNARLIALIPPILPNARILYSRRHPVEICLSCYRTNFNADSYNFSNELARLGRAYRLHHDMMEFWKSVMPEGSMIEVWHEELVRDTEAQMRRVFGYLDVPWNEKWREAHKIERPVHTASALQVRQPTFDIGDRWRKYEPYLGPLLQELGPLVREERRRLRDQPSGGVA